MVPRLWAPEQPYQSRPVVDEVLQAPKPRNRTGSAHFLLFKQVQKNTVSGGLYKAVSTQFSGTNLKKHNTVSRHCVIANTTFNGVIPTKGIKFLKEIYYTLFNV